MEITIISLAQWTGIVAGQVAIIGGVWAYASRRNGYRKINDCETYRKDIKSEIKNLYGKVDKVHGDVQFIKGKME